ncbi:MAG TPA: choice-of-anchor Q domain-containing protein, partial [Chitinophagaceae bacterium]|nr:choice-of-anchor Q domain-containing protein [Chitinophagaceae bacterium]
MLFVFFGLTANATTYYVSLNGNDANSGTLMTSPWKTIAKINRSTFLPGDSILFRKGDTWREQLTLPSSGSLGNLITFGAYGSGAKPIINAADVMTGWTNIGSNLWYIISPNVVPTRAMVVIGGIIYAEVASLAACNSGNKYFIDISTNRLYVFSIVDPGTLTAEVSKREYCIVTASGINSKRFIEIDDIEVRYAGNSGICFEGPGTSLGAAFNGSSFVRRCTAYANNLDGIVHRDHYDNFTVEDCDASYNGNGFYSWIADGGTFRRCTSSNQIQYNVTFTDGEAFGGYQSDNWLVENCVSNSDYDAIHIDAGGRSLNAIIRYNKVYNSSSGLPATPGMGVGSLGVGGSIKIYYNLIVNCASNGFECYTDMIGKCEYYNNTIYENTSTGSNSGIYLKNAANFIFKNNIIVRDYVQYKTLFLIEVLPNISTNDYNLYYILNDPGTHFRAYFGAYYSTLATWQAATGQDAHSLSSNPLFKNVLSDWSLQPGSPCINTGVDVGLTRDILGNPIVGLPDMGAYEYTTANANPIANAGNDISLTLPVTVATLNGSAVDPDGTIASYSWSRVSGPGIFSLTNSASAITTVTGLTTGIYVFRLT